MNLIICPGIHPAQLTQEFATRLQLKCDRVLIFPTEQYPAYSAIDIYHWLKSSKLSSEIVIIAFSAGVVGAIGAALAWQIQGGQIKALIAFDGWGVPLWGNFPIYRFSHDRFTHWSSAILGAGNEGFYADPPVAHLDLWRSPETCWGWKVIRPGLKTPCSAIDYLQSLLEPDLI